MNQSKPDSLLDQILVLLDQCTVYVAVVVVYQQEHCISCFCSFFPPTILRFNCSTDWQIRRSTCQQNDSSSTIGMEHLFFILFTSTRNSKYLHNAETYAQQVLKLIGTNTIKIEKYRYTHVAYKAEHLLFYVRPIVWPPRGCCTSEMIVNKFSLEVENSNCEH